MDKNLYAFLEKGIERPDFTVDEFEDRVAKYIGVRYVLAVESGTAALHLALLSIGAEKADRVIIPDFVCAALLNAVRYTGAEPVIADVEDDFNIGADMVKKTLKVKKAKAVVVAHMFGKNCSIDEMSGLGVPLIEDFTFTAGGDYKGKKSGSFGDISICSLSRTKVFTAQKGGVLLTNNRIFYKRAKELSYYDKKDEYHTCFNYRMSGLTAALALYSLKKFPVSIEKRKKLAEVYYRILTGVRGLKLPVRTDDHIYSRFVVTGGEPLRKKLVISGIDARKPVYKLLHRYLSLADGVFPVSTSLYKNSFCLPLYPWMSEKDVERISTVVRSQLLTKKGEVANA